MKAPAVRKNERRERRNTVSPYATSSTFHREDTLLNDISRLREGKRNNKKWTTSENESRTSVAVKALQHDTCFVVWILQRCFNPFSTLFFPLSSENTVKRETKFGNVSFVFHSFFLSIFFFQIRCRGTILCFRPLPFFWLGLYPFISPLTFNML